MNHTDSIFYDPHQNHKQYICLIKPALTGAPTAPIPGGPCGPGGPISPVGPYEIEGIHDDRTEVRSHVCYSIYTV